MFNNFPASRQTDAHFHVWQHFHACFLLGDKVLNIARVSALNHNLVKCNAKTAPKYKLPIY